MSKYDELARIYLQAKDEHENNGILCQNFAHNLMKSIFRAFGCPSGIMVGDTKGDQKNFWNTSFLPMIASLAALVFCIAFFMWDPISLISATSSEIVFARTLAEIVMQKV